MGKKTTLLDLGSEVIKALEVEQSGVTENIIRAVSVSGAVPYLDEKGLKSMDGLVCYVDEILKKNNFTSKRLVISSSAFGISTTVEVTDKPTKELNGLKKDNLTLSTYQVYGESKTEQSSKHHYAISTAERLPIESLVKTFKQHGYTVVSIEGSETAIMNLIKLKSWTYDIPDKLILRFGHRLFLYGFSQDALKFIEHPDALFTIMVEMISSRLKCDYGKFRDVFMTVGIKRTTEGMARLERERIDSESYYNSVQSFCRDALNDLKRTIDGITEDYRINHYYLIVTGGFVDVPGVYDLLEEIFNDNATTIVRGAISRRYSDKYKTIENKLPGHVSDIGCLYGDCIGLMFKDRFGTKANLLPPEKPTPKGSSVIISATKILIAALAVFTFMYGGKVLKNIWDYVHLPEISNAAEINSEYQSLVARERSLRNRLKAIKTIDKTAIKIIEFAGSYNDPLLSIVSIDTQDMLNPDSANSEKTSSVPEEKKPASPFADISEEPEEEVEEAPAERAIIIRGYALSSAAVSQFSSSIYDAGISDKVYVDGVEKVELPSGESLYIFQIYLEQPQTQSQEGGNVG